MSAERRLTDVLVISKLCFEFKLINSYRRIFNTQSAALHTPERRSTDAQLICILF